MFHHFPDEEGVGDDCLVRSTDFTYRNEQRARGSHERHPICIVHCLGHPVGLQAPARDGGYAARNRCRRWSSNTARPVIQDESPGDRRREPREPAVRSRRHALSVGGPGRRRALGHPDRAGRGWFYKRNLSPSTSTRRRPRRSRSSAPFETGRAKPSLAALSSGQQQLLDLAGDGQLDLVELRRPCAGLLRAHARRRAGSRSRLSYPCPISTGTIPTSGSSTSTGDGHADILITEDEVFTWYPSLAEAGFGPAQQCAPGARRRERPAAGLRRRHAVHLSRRHVRRRPDRSGAHPQRRSLLLAQPGLRPLRRQGHDGQRALVRPPGPVRPAAHPPGRHRRLRRHRHHLPRPRRRSPLLQPVRQQLERAAHASPRSRTLTISSAVTAVDLLGNGTACLVWSSPLPGDARRPMRYIDLMGGQKAAPAGQDRSTTSARKRACSTRRPPSSTSRTSSREALDHQSALPGPCRRARGDLRPHQPQPLRHPLRLPSRLLRRRSSASSAASAWSSNGTPRSSRR